MSRRRTKQCGYAGGNRVRWAYKWIPDFSFTGFALSAQVSVLSGFKGSQHFSSDSYTRLFISFFMLTTCFSACASLILAICAIFGIPTSWKKLQLGPSILWIGWTFHFRAGAFTVPQDKLDRLRLAIDDLLRSRTVSRKGLQKVVGLLQWLVQLFWVAKPWLHCLYKDVNTLLGTLFSVGPGLWVAFCDCLDDDLRFVYDHFGGGQAFDCSACQSQYSAGLIAGPCYGEGGVDSGCRPCHRQATTLAN